MNIKNLKRKNFTPKEFIDSATAKTEGIDNYIYDIDVLVNMNRVADKMQEIRNLLKSPININSGYRCLKLNRLIGSKDYSQHIKGEACDFTCKGFGNSEKIIRFLKQKNIIVDQCLAEGGWVHISIKATSENRNEFALYLPDNNGIRKKIII